MSREQNSYGADENDDGLAQTLGRTPPELAEVCTLNSPRTRDMGLISSDVKKSKTPARVASKLDTSCPHVRQNKRPHHMKDVSLSSLAGHPKLAVLSVNLGDQ